MSRVEADFQSSSGAGQPLVSVVIVTYNSARHLSDLLESLARQTHRSLELIFVDSGSKDDTVERLRREAPSARIIASGENLGYRRGTNRGAELASGEYILVLNDDVELDRRCIELLVETMQDPRVGIATPLITYHQQRDRVNAAGNRLSISGFYSARGKGQDVSAFRDTTRIAAVSGCCFLYRRDVYRRMGAFSRDFDLYPAAWHASYEDVDLSWRIRMAGYEVILAPQALVHHKYVQKPLSAARFESMVFGRALLLLRGFEGRSLLRLSPYLLLVEIALLTYASVRGPGYLGPLVRVWKWLLMHRGELQEMRRTAQRFRRRPDAELMPYLDAMVEVTPSLKTSAFVSAGCRWLAAVSMWYRTSLLGWDWNAD
jgi:GT2 family glycosyltransferase